jgi:hypothetical protein
MENLALRFIRWGIALMILGLLTGYGPLAHYLHGGVEVACPWAPIHGHVGLLGWIGMTLFGLVYQVVPKWSNGKSPSLKLATAHLYICVTAVMGVMVNGMVGYRILDKISPSFYYIPNHKILNIWLSIDGMFLSLYGVGCFLFLIVVSRLTANVPEARSSV